MIFVSKLDTFSLLAQQLKYNTTLKQLWLKGCGLNSQSAASLAEALTTNKHLKQLSISDNALCDDSIQRLACALRVNQWLKVLSLHSCGTRAILYDVNYQAINFHRINSVRIQLNSSNQLGIDMSIRTPICQWSYLWVISACQGSICIDRYWVVSFFYLSQWHPEHNAHSCHFLQWLNLSIPTEEERPFILRGEVLSSLAFSSFMQ